MEYSTSVNYFILYKNEYKYVFTYPPEVEDKKFIVDADSIMENMSKSHSLEGKHGDILKDGQKMNPHGYSIQRIICNDCQEYVNTKRED